MDYGGAGAPLLVVPSLVNRAYILDLMPQKSLLRWLAANGLRPLLVDWGTPGDLERRFTLTDYIARRPQAAPHAPAAAARQPTAGTGYCLGRGFALSLAGRPPQRAGAPAPPA